MINKIQFNLPCKLLCSLIMVSFCTLYSELGAQVSAYPFDFTDKKVEVKEENPTSSANLAKLFDNDENSVYKVEGVSSTRISITLPYQINLSGYALGVPSGGSTGGWKVQYSATGRIWNEIPVDKVSKKGELEIYTLNSTAIKAKYFRLQATGNNKVEIGEWQLFGVPYVDENDQFPDDVTTENTLIIPSNIGFDAVRNNIPYEKTYIYSISIDIPKGARKLVLPANSNVLIFSATLAEDEVNTIYPATELIDSSLEK